MNNFNCFYSEDFDKYIELDSNQDILNLYRVFSEYDYDNKELRGVVSKDGERLGSFYVGDEFDPSNVTDHIMIKFINANGIKVKGELPSYLTKW